MTLALYGKSRKRKGGLLLIGLLAVVLAITAGAALRPSENAAATGCWFNCPKPDLVANKTNDTGGTVGLGDTFTWTIQVRNQGAAEAVFSRFLWWYPTIFTDNLPAGATYSNLQVTDSGMGDDFDDMVCTLASNTISCRVADGMANVKIGVGNGFNIAVDVTPTAAGTLTNPATRGICKVDPDGKESESNENNNTCSNEVTVFETGNLIIHKVNQGGPDGDQFTADITGGAQNIPFSESTPSTAQQLNAGPYTVTEDPVSGYQYLGWALATNVGTPAPQWVCPGGPGEGQTGNASVTIAAGQETHLCFYNRP